MISDVLVDALDQIEEYERDEPDAYGDEETAELIAKVKKAMHELLVYLNTPPPPDAFKEVK